MNLRFIIPRNFRCALFLTALCAAGLFADGRFSRLDPPSDHQVVAFVTDSVEWYRHLSLLRQFASDSGDLLFLQESQALATQILQLSFDFAKADASLTAAPAASHNAQAGIATADASPDVARFVQLDNQAEKAIRETNEKIDGLNQKLSTAHRSERKQIEGALDETRSRLALLQAGSAGVKNLLDLLRNSGTDNSQTGNLTSAINDLAQTVPEVTNPTTASSSTQSSDSSPTPKPSGPGILGMFSRLSLLQNKLRTLNEESNMTASLAASAENLRVPLVGFINRAVQSGDMKDLQASDLHTLEQQKAQLDDLTVRIKAVSPAIAALNKQKVLLAAYKSHLARWRSAVVSEYESAWKGIILRLVIVVVILSFLALLGRVLQRVTEAHIHDPNRRRIALAIQRVVIWSAIVLAGMLAFASGLGSMATFFGLVTAGVAVAIQSVIVASLGYFVLVGKRGIKLGDRVQISGITGEVIEIGLLQFQIREFNRQTEQLTDNVVTFSNSFVFVSPATGLIRHHPQGSTTAQLPAVTNGSQVTSESRSAARTGSP